MKKSWSNKPWRVLLILPLALLLDACQPDAKSTEPAVPAAETHQHPNAGELYTCPMHPQIIRNEPGACPICGMDLVKKPTESAPPAPAGGQLRNLLRSPNATVVSTQPTVRLIAEVPELTLTLPGRVEYDVRRTESIAARFGGRVEKLMVRYNYQPVTKGQKLLELYSPELVTAQQELIFLLTNDSANHSLIRGARRKLSLLGLTDAQINRTAATRKPQYQVALYSPYTGYVVEQPARLGIATATPAAATSTPGMSSDPMGGSGAAGEPAAPATPAQTGLSLTEGAYVTAGQTLFRVVNTKQVWGVFQPRPDELAALRVGQTIRVVPDDNPARALTARIDFIEPFFREDVSTAAVRVHLPNPNGRLRRGNLLTGSVQVAAASGLWLPREAVVDLGNRQVAFVRQNGAFRPVPVQTGLRSAKLVQILHGLTAQDAVAANAQFLVDSEGFIQTTNTDYGDE